MEFLNYPGDGTVGVTHHSPTLGTHTLPVDLASLEVAKHNPDLLVVKCPSKDCNATTYVPINGGTEAQLLHAQVAYAKGKHKSIGKAIDAIAKDVEERGHHPYVKNAHIQDKKTGASCVYYQPKNEPEPERTEPETQPDFVGIRSILRNATPEERATLTTLFKRMQEQQEAK
jgi:hypothetical protein